MLSDNDHIIWFIFCLAFSIETPRMITVCAHIGWKWSVTDMVYTMNSMTWINLISGKTWQEDRKWKYIKFGFPKETSYFEILVIKEKIIISLQKPILIALKVYVHNMDKVPFNACLYLKTTAVRKRVQFNLTTRKGEQLERKMQRVIYSKFPHNLAIF